MASAGPGLGACQVGIQRGLGRELGRGVRHPEIIHGERGFPGAPISLARVEVDLAAWKVHKARAGALDVGPRPERPEIAARLKEQIPYYEVRLLVTPA